MQHWHRQQAPASESPPETARKRHEIVAGDQKAWELGTEEWRASLEQQKAHQKQVQEDLAKALGLPKQ